MKTYEEIRYHIEVEHKPGTFESDMDSLTSDAKNAYERLQALKGKYPGCKISVTQIVERRDCQPVSENDLEKIVQEGPQFAKLLMLRHL